MASCPDYETWKRFVSGLLTDAELAPLQSHLDNCPACLAELERAEAETRQAVQSTTKTAAPLKPGAGGLPPIDSLLSLVKPKATGNSGSSLAAKTVQANLRATLESSHESSSLSSIDSIMFAAEPSLEFLAPPEQADELGRLGTYRVVRRLGHGGMGLVVLAEDITSKRQVALKMMLPMLAGRRRYRERFLREARATAALKHENIVTIFQVGEDRNVPFIAMEYLAGESLQNWLDHRLPLQIDHVLRLGKDIANGLAAAHEHGLVHRDIKPSNVFLRRAADLPHDHPGTGVIVDFGLAHAQAEDTRLTVTGTVLGTPAFMSPEQARGESLDGRADLYSLGAVLFLLCTQQLPFSGINTMAMLSALLTERPKSVRELNPKVPESLSSLVRDLLRKDRAYRPQSAREVVTRLEQAEQELALVGAPASTETRLHPIAGRKIQIVRKEP